jgi:hydrogenase maturation protease
VSARVLVAGVGNIFLGDDGFGVEVANRMAGTRPWPDGVEVVEYGIRGVHLAYQLLEGYDALVLVDAVDLGEDAGTLAVIDPRIGSTIDDSPAVDAHTMSPDVVLGTLAHLGGSLERAYVVGCQPADLSESIGLSPAVAAAIEPAIDLCFELISEILQPAGKGIWE